MAVGGFRFGSCSMASPIRWDDRGRLLAGDLNCSSRKSIPTFDSGKDLHSVLGGSPVGFHVVEESNKHF